MTNAEEMPCDRPFLIVVPNNLLDQWLVEFKRYVRPGTFDVFPVTGTMQSRLDSEKEWFERSHANAYRRVIIATHSVSLFALLYHTA